MTLPTPHLLDDGRLVTVRPIRGADTPALRAMHRRLSENTVRLRFFAPLPELAPATAEHFTHVDGCDRCALVAQDPAGELVAVARYDRLADPGEAEVAVVVQDSYQHHGLGTVLLRELVACAREHGVERFVADVLIGNTGMLHAFADAGLTGTATYDGDVATLVMPLPEAVAVSA